MWQRAARRLVACGATHAVVVSPILLTAFTVSLGSKEDSNSLGSKGDEVI